MSPKIILKKATRIEGNANIQIEIGEGRVKTARLLVHDFRGFEKFMHGRYVEYVPHLISRICGLCSTAHHVVSLRAIEEALGVDVPPSVNFLRDICTLAERISSHSLSYFFLTMPDFVGTRDGVFQLMNDYAETIREANILRNGGQEIVQIIGKRSTHPIAMGVGRFLYQPSQADLKQIRHIAAAIKKSIERLIREAGKIGLPKREIVFPEDHEVKLLAYSEQPDNETFHVFNRRGEILTRFARHEFSDNISEMRAEWTFAKFPYLKLFGFPDGILLVGPLSRLFIEGGVFQDPELARFSLTEKLHEVSHYNLEIFDTCRLLEIFLAAQKILTLVDQIDLSDLYTEVDFDVSGHGIGVMEAPRGTLVHDYLINRGHIERIRLLVATQLNNSYINLLIKDLAGKHIEDNALSQEGERLINRCIRLFDPCMSCATH